MFYSRTVGILKIITFGLLISANGTLSAISTEGNCAERPKAALSLIPIEWNCAKWPKGALSEILTLSTRSRLRLSATSPLSKICRL